MTDGEFTPDGDLDERLRAAMSGAAPDAPAIGVIGYVERRAEHQRRRVRELVAAGLVILLGGAAAIGYWLSIGLQGTFAGPAATSTTSTSTTSPVGATAAESQAKDPGLHDGDTSPPTSPPCKADQSTPSWSTSFCGPAPHTGNGSGPDGICNGTETTPPCGPGVVSGHYYAYTMPGTCTGLITFDGKQWVSELPPPNVVPDYYVWISLSANGFLGWISPNGSVGFRPYVGQDLATCDK